MEWIDVNDRLPPLGEWYLICGGTNPSKPFTTMGFLDGVSGDDSVIWLTHNDTQDDEWENVTHWMPLPSPPNT